MPLLFQREDADPNTPQSRVLGPFASAGVRGEDQVFRRKGITFSKHARVVEDGVVAVGGRGVGSQPNQGSRPQSLAKLPLAEPSWCLKRLRVPPLASK